MEEVINSAIYRDDFHYGYFLASYIRLISKKQKEFAQEISIDETRLSRIIHRKELPMRNCSSGWNYILEILYRPYTVSGWLKRGKHTISISIMKEEKQKRNMC